METEKKYVFTGETRKIYYAYEQPTTVYRIKAVRNFGNVKEGELGGWIQTEFNLSHDGNCWVADDAIVYDAAQVKDNAQVEGNSIISGNANIEDCAIVRDDAEVKGDAKVYQKAGICGFAVVQDQAEVFEKAVISGTAVIKDSARVFGDSYCGKNAIIGGNTRIYGMSIIMDNAAVYKTEHVLNIGPVVSSNNFCYYITFYRNLINEVRVSFSPNFFNYSLYEIIRIIKKNYLKGSKERKFFKKAVKLAKLQILGEIEE